MQVSTVTRYPVKSMLGQQVDEAVKDSFIHVRPASARADLFSARVK